MIESMSVCDARTPRRVRRAAPVNSSDSVSTAMPAPGSAKPSCSGPTASAAAASAPAKAAQSSSAGSARPWSASSCASVSRRPGDSATISLRSGEVSKNAASRSTGFGARRFTATSGSVVANAALSVSGPGDCGSGRAIDQRPKRRASTKNWPPSMNSSSGRSNGRSGSCDRKRKRWPASSAKRRDASSTSPCETTRVVAGK